MLVSKELMDPLFFIEIAMKNPRGESLLSFREIFLFNLGEEKLEFFFVLVMKESEEKSGGIEKFRRQGETKKK